MPDSTPPPVTPLVPEGVSLAPPPQRNALGTLALRFTIAAYVVLAVMFVAGGTGQAFMAFYNVMAFLLACCACLGFVCGLVAVFHPGPKVAAALGLGLSLPPLGLTVMTVVASM